LNPFSDSTAPAAHGYHDHEALYGNAAVLQAMHAGEEFDEEDDEVLFGRALYDYRKTSSAELSFAAGDLIELIGCDNDDPWWSGVLGEAEGKKGCNPKQRDINHDG
jgi:hypothetical protein